MINNKISLFEKLNNKDYIALELGCGSNKIIKDAIGIDQFDSPCVDIVGDVIEVLSSLPSDSIDRIYSHHFVEHVDNLSLLIAEKTRVLKSGGIIEIVVPHFSNPYFYSDYTHKRFFGLYSMSYFSESDIFIRKVPKYNNKLSLELLSVTLNFKAERPFYLRYIFGKLFSLLINLSNYNKEFYEINLSNLYSCHDIIYIMKKI